MTPVERVHKPTAAGVKAYVSGPPENVADADVVNRDLGKF
jgi:hypothetical protein